MATKYRQIIQNLSFAGELVNTTVVEWIDEHRQGDARNATPEDLAAIGDASASGYLAQIARLQEEHAAALATAQGRSGGGGISKLTLKRRLDAMGKWAEFKLFLFSLGDAAVDEFNLAAEIRVDDPVFVQIAPLAKESLALTDEQWTSLLSS